MCRFKQCTFQRSSEVQKQAHLKAGSMTTCFAESVGAPGSGSLQQVLPTLAVAVAQKGLQSKKLFLIDYRVYEHKGLYQRSILQVAFCLSSLAKCSLPDGKSGTRWHVRSTCSVHDSWMLMHCSENMSFLRLLLAAMLICSHAQMLHS